jgi:hypothetical protein
MTSVESPTLGTQLLAVEDVSRLISFHISCRIEPVNQVDQGKERGREGKEEREWRHQISMWEGEVVRPSHLQRPFPTKTQMGRRTWSSRSSPVNELGHFRQPP